MLVLAFLFLIACTCANAKSEPSLDDIIDLLKKIDFATLADIHNKLKNLTNVVINSLEITEEEKILLKEKIEKLRDPPLSGELEDILMKRNVFYYTLQGDIMLTREQGDALIEDVKRLEGGAPLRKPRGVYPDVSYKWPMKMIHYSFHKSASDKVMQVFRNAANAWSKDTCVDIIEDKSGLKKNGVIVASAPFCASFLGKAGVPQMIFLNEFCETFRSAAHELGHTLGLLHQEGREDRDKYIRIVIENLELNQTYMAFKQTQETNKDYRIDYDFGSIMEIGSLSGSSNGKPTIASIDRNYMKNLRSESISFADLYLVNIHYNCSGSCKKHIECKNGGFQHPRDCDRCICPGGYGGSRCDRRPSGCGSKKYATTHWRALTEDLRNDNPHRYLDGYKKCTYWIKSPRNTKIQIRIAAIKNSFNKTDLYCNDGGVEVKANEDQRLTGYKFCSNDDRPNITSHYNLVPIIFFNRTPYENKISIQYRYVKNSAFVEKNE